VSGGEKEVTTCGAVFGQVRQGTVKVCTALHSINLQNKTLGVPEDLVAGLLFRPDLHHVTRTLTLPVRFVIMSRF